MSTVLVLSSPIHTTYHDTVAQAGASNQQTCKTSMRTSTMPFIKDSFDSDPGSSPRLLTEEEISKLKKMEKTPRGAAIPEGVATGFRRVSELLRDADAARLKFESLSTNSPAVEQETSEPKKRRRTTAVEEQRKPKTVQARKKKDVAKTDQTITAVAEDPETCTSRFFSTEAGPANDKPTTDGINKQKNQLEPDDVSKQTFKDPTLLGHESQARSSRFSQQTHDLGNHPVHGSSPRAQDSHQPQATAAEDDWPPERARLHDPEPTSANHINPLLDLTDEHNLRTDQDDPARVDEFRDFVRAYGNKDQSATIQPPIGLVPSGVSKLQSRSTSKSISPTKPALRRIASPVKRKQLTVTEKAVEEFRPEEVPDSLSLLEYFPVVEAEGTALKPKSKPRATRKTTKPEKKSSLLPPSDALRSLDKQNFIYNTSSQLMVHSSSPTYNDSTDLGLSKISNTSTLKRDDSFIDVDVLIESASILGFKSSKSLWSAATRNEDGSLMTSEVIDLSETPRQHKLVDEPNASKLITSANGQTAAEVEPDLQDPSESTRGRPLGIFTEPQIPVSHITKAIPALPRSLGEAATRERPTSKSPVKKKRRIKDAEPKPMKPEDCFKKVSFADLKEEVKNFGLKPPRSRAKNIELILQCRAQQHDTTKSTVVMPLESDKPAPTGQISAIQLPVVENPTETIRSKASDADSLLTEIPPLPKSKRKRKPVTTILEVDDEDSQPPPSFQTPAKDSELHDEDDEEKIAALMLGIHQAIMSQPPTHMIKDPSWREKMAMYDPIVLEELTTWLNTGGLDAVGVDAEVWPALVRDWCESKSVCFIWASEGWRKKRS